MIGIVRSPHQIAPVYSENHIGSISVNHQRHSEKKKEPEDF
jgi:hypothetical protein